MTASAKIVNIENETFEQRIARETAETNEKIRQAKKTMRAVFKVLGMPEKVYPKSTEREYSAWLECEQGARIIGLECGGYNTGWERLRVTGTYPRDKKGQYVHAYNPTGGGEMPSPEIYISIKKSPEKIAAEIIRRFMPDYDTRLAIVQKYVKQHNDYEDKTNDNAKRLKRAQGMPGEKLTSHEEATKCVDIQFTKGDGYGHAEISGDSIKIELRSLTIEQAEKIIKSLN